MIYWLNSPSHSLLASWALYSLAVVGLSAGLYFVSYPTWIAFRRLRTMKSPDSVPAWNIWSALLGYLYTTRPMARPTSRNVGMIGLLVFFTFSIGFIFGYQTRTVVQASNIDTWAPVHILTRHDDSHYTVAINGQPDTEKTELILCPDSANLARFEPGSWLQSITFERRPDCLSVAAPNIGWRSFWTADSKPIITEVMTHVR